ncbi:hypothetical protein RUM43_002250 [Polyplax serrata]|uniref:Uncharacterized protein n=1 Tax=Polyplax serrata TaxID=468196 RepID=A0AAN8PFQ4_POLSC
MCIRTLGHPNGEIALPISIILSKFPSIFDFWLLSRKKKEKSPLSMPQAAPNEGRGIRAELRPCKLQVPRWMRPKWLALETPSSWTHGHSIFRSSSATGTTMSFDFRTALLKAFSFILVD